MKKSIAFICALILLILLSSCKNAPVGKQRKEQNIYDRITNSPAATGYIIENTKNALSKLDVTSDDLSESTHTYIIKSNMSLSDYIITCILNPKLLIFNFALIILLVYGVASALSPHKIWQIFRSWKFQTLPQTEYFVAKRIQGIVIALFSIFMLIRPFIERYIYMMNP